MVYPAERGAPAPGYDDSHFSISEQFDRNVKPGHNSVASGTQFGGQTWFDVLSHMGGCPAELVDAWDAVINQRLQVAS